MTTASVHHRRPWLPALNTILAGGAVVIAVFALATAPAEVSRVVTQSPTADISEGLEDIPSNLTPPPWAAPNVAATPLLDGCEQHVDFQRC